MATPRGIALRVAALVGGLAALVLALVAIALILLDTAAGHRFLVGVIQQQVRPANGLRIRVGRIDGSIYGRMTVRDLALADPRGIFLSSPAVAVDWSPLPLASKHLVIHELSAGTIDLLRKPALKATPPKPNQPLLPNFGVTIDRLNIASLILEPPVTGERRAVAIGGGVDLQHGRALVDLKARARAVDGRGGGDLAIVSLDARPAANRLKLAAHITAPKGGVIDALAGLGKPAVFDVSGAGDWRDWHGHAGATVGDRQVLDAALSAANGLFTARGRAEPGRLVKAAARLTQPFLTFDIAARVKDRSADLRANAASATMQATAAGGVDLGRNLFHGLRLSLATADPSAAAPQLSGRDLRLGLVLDGPFARPLIGYDLTARSLGFAGTTLEGVSAHGQSTRLAGGAVRIPVALTAARVSGPGKPPTALTHVALSGPITIGRDGGVTADLAIRSDQARVSLAGRGSPRTNAYQGHLGASLDAGLVRQVGLGGALGGGATMSLDLARSPNAALRVTNLRLASPKFRIVAGHGALLADGRVDLAVDATSPDYGPLRLTAGGTVETIHAHLSAPNPKALSITNLEADVRRARERLTITATAASAYGPVSANADVGMGPPLTIDLHPARLDGLSLAGKLVKTSAGPFAGRLALTGDGLAGTLQLTAAGKSQAVDANIRAQQANLPMPTPLLIRGGRIRVNGVFGPGAPAISGQATVSGLRQGALAIDAAHIDGTWRGGAGQATVTASGNNGAPFRVAAAARFTPSLIEVTGEGAVRGITARLQGPMLIRHEAATWRLAPTTVVLPRGGRVQLAGTYGKASNVSARLEGVDLGLARAFKPSLEIAGKVSGSADVSLPAGGAAPSGRLALQIVDLTRTGATTVSEPVDISLLGDVSGAGADVHALLRRDGAVVGRAEARVTPGGAGSYLHRMQTGQITGGVRYNGPSEAVWSLAGISGQALSGPVAVGADFSGRMDHPDIRGAVHARNLHYENSAFGTRIDNIAVEGRFLGTRFQLDSLTGRTPGGGTMSASGFADLSAADGWPVNMTLKFSKAELAGSRTVGARLSGTITATNSRQQGALISGDLDVLDARYQIAQSHEASALELEGVHWKGQPVTAAGGPEASSGPPSQWKLNIRVRADNQIMVNGMGLASEWSSDLRIEGDIKHPIIVGEVRSVRGSFSFGGRRLTLDDSTIHFNGSTPPDPTLEISASADVNGVTATINIAGTADRPQITFSSTPALPEDEVLSRLMFGSSQPQLSPLQALQLAASLNALRGGGGGVNPLAKISQATGLQNLRFEMGNAQTGQGPSIGAGKYITNNIYVDVLTDARGFTATQIQVAITRALSILSQLSTTGATSGSIRYSHRY